MNINFRIAVKAFIVKDGSVLILKRRSDDAHKPGKWDLPGGRLEVGENPMTGLKRETLEEVGLVVEPLIPIVVHHFTRDDDQLITMIIFLCQLTKGKVKLSDEHQDYEWVKLSEKRDKFPAWLHSVLDNHQTYIKPR